MSDGKMDVSGAAYEINGMLKACILACDPMERRQWHRKDTHGRRAHVGRPY